MDLASPLSAVIPGLDAPVLAALARSLEWASGAQIHRRAGVGSDTGVRKVLVRLVAQGVVDDHRVGGTTLYRLNVDHLTYPHIVGLVRLRDDLVVRIRDEIEGWSLPAWHASIFGSFARGDADAGSDVDLFIVPARDLGDVLDTGPWRDQLAGLADHIVRWTGNVAQVFDVDLAHLADMIAADEPLLRSWRDDHLHLLGEDLTRMLHAVMVSSGPSAAEPR